jgi:hypothetical protein
MNRPSGLPVVLSAADGNNACKGKSVRCPKSLFFYHDASTPFILLQRTGAKILKTLSSKQLKPPSISAEYSSLRRSRTEARGDSICLMFKPCLKKRKKEKKKKKELL